MKEREESGFLEEIETYWKERDKEWERRRRSAAIFFVLATVGVITAAVGFLLEIFGVLKEAGIALGISGIVMTLISAIWGAGALVDQIGEVRRDIRGNAISILKELKNLMRKEADRIIEEVKKRT